MQVFIFKFCETNTKGQPGDCPTSPSQIGKCNYYYNK